MTMKTVLERLYEMLEKAHADRDYALACYGSARQLILWLERTAKKEGIRNMPGVHEKLYYAYRGFLDAAGMLTEDRTANPYQEACSALSILDTSTLLGERDVVRKHILCDLFEE